MLSRTFAGVLALGFTSGLGAQDVLTAQVAVDRALARAAVVDHATATVQAATSDVLAARTWPNPELSLEYEQGDRTADASNETTFMLSQRLELGGRRALERRAAELGVDAASAEVEVAQQRLRAEVLRKYYAAVQAESHVQALDAWTAGLAELARIAEQRRREGDLSGFESLRIAQHGTRAQLRRDAADAARIATREALGGLVGGVLEGVALDPASELIPPAVPPFSDTPASAQLAALDLRRVHAAAGAEAAGRLRVPITVGVGQKRFDGIGARDDALVLELSMPLPVFDRDQAERLRSDAELLRAESALALAQAELASRRRAAWHEARALSTAAERMQREVVPQARELTRIARASFAEGELDLVGLLGAFDAEIEATEQALELAGRARNAFIDLSLLTQGEPP